MLERQLTVFLMGGRMSRIAKRTGHFGAGRTCSHNDEVQGAFLDERGIAFGSLKDRENARAQALGIMEGIQRVAVLVGPRCAEEVRLRPSRKHQKVALILLSVRSYRGTGCEVGGDNLGHYHVHIRVLFENTAQTESGIAGRQHGRGYLIEQRLELLIVILVEQCDPNIRMRSQLAGTVQTGETATYDDNVLHP